MDTSQTCSPGGAGALQQGIDDGELEWQHNGIVTTVRHGLAGTIWHEGLHNLGYGHDADCGYAPSAYNRHKSINDMIPACISEILGRSSDSANAGCDNPSGDWDGPDALASCGESGYMIVSEWNAAGTPVACHCVEDSTVATAATNDHFGSAVATGDYDNDGFDDLAIGATGESSSGGFVYLYRGSNAGLRFWRRITQANVGFADESGDLFGSTLAVGDFNNDGYSDLAIGAPGEDLGAVTDAGWVTIVPGGPDGLQVAYAQGLGQSQIGGADEANDKFGSALSSGDFNGDGQDDLAIGVPYEEAGANPTDSGYVYVVKGVTQPIANRVFVQALTGIAQNTGNAGGTIHSPETADLFGYSVAFLRRPSGVGHDLMVGVPGENTGRGTAHFVGWNGGSPYVANDYGAGVPASSGFGASIATGDFVGDSKADVVFGAPYASATGKIYRATGGIIFPVSTAEIGLCSGYVGPANASFLGWAVAVDSVNRKVLIGAPGWVVDGEVWRGTHVGPTFCYAPFADEVIDTYSGSDTFCLQNHNTSTGCAADIRMSLQCPIDNVPWIQQTNSKFGFSLARGDFDGDGDFEDAVGAPMDEIDDSPHNLADGPRAGSVYVLGMKLRPWTNPPDMKVRIDQKTTFYGVQ